ncbi:TfoX/Sxy family protein [Aquipuribacter sp. SD81]|uniref:TfoX/Sxy family protein n=1 Tax=Aquipuribacter sp. SD81 TaxID=3127703 RepID=UPI0030170A53
MTADPDLVQRLRALVGEQPGTAERRMFGGVAFLLDGHMAVGASGAGGLMVRADPADLDDLLREPGAHPFEMRGRPMRGWLRVDASAVPDDEALGRWVDVGVGFVRTLPAKPTD